MIGIALLITVGAVGLASQLELVMTNLQEGGETVMQKAGIKYGVDLNDTLFTARNLNLRQTKQIFTRKYRESRR